MSFDEFRSCGYEADKNVRLFDMDGTLIDSTAGVQGAWEKFAQKYPFIDLKEILSCQYLIYLLWGQSFDSIWDIAAHGVRTEDNLRKYCGVTDPEELKVCATHSSTFKGELDDLGGERFI
jgi:phosphoglycolate phosphatase-like HAD superfamily hydrolase